jgi:hypothetical protein
LQNVSITYKHEFAIHSTGNTTMITKAVVTSNHLHTHTYTSQSTKPRQKFIHFNKNPLNTEILMSPAVGVLENYSISKNF